MSGRWRIDPSEIGKHDHLLIETDEGRRLALNDPRRFGSLDLVRDRRAGRVAAVRRARAGADRPRRARLKRGSPGGGPRSSCCCSTSASSPGSAISTSARRCTAPGSSAARGRIGFADAARSGWSRRSTMCSTRRSRPAARACAILPAPTANSAISQSASRSMTARASLRCGGTVRRIVQGGRSTFFCPQCQH